MAANSKTWPDQIYMLCILTPVAVCKYINAFIRTLQCTHTPNIPLKFDSKLQGLWFGLFKDMVYKLTGRCCVLFFSIFSMTELHPHSGAKLGLGCGKAPYIRVTDCRLREQMTVNRVKVNMRPTRFTGHPSLG